MALAINGTYVDDIIYDGVSLNKVIFNGVTVWERPSVVLTDFTYNFDSTNGLCEITGWKGTYNGASSTNCIIPDGKGITDIKI